MILILGLLILIAALVVGVAGISGNSGAGHGLGRGGDFSVFGYDVTGSTGNLFLAGIVVGAGVMLGLTLVVLSARRSPRRSAARARRDTVAPPRESGPADRERDDPVGERNATGAAGTAAAGETRAGRGRHWFGHRAAPR
ncbi:hypothetical protein AMK16_21920 [Streptomyces sp. CB00455]|uniref:hypothetical protein n=1 Tax=Streptomyces sp. CB00455 TaxID=1703927 RepID=UPI00093C9D68|nr:hypothetical protein [Streptomyces sp. CB00455]OKK17483.1 hypothetical protein AMK16_21920 [Streptomyces sp. CB00455]